MKTKIKLTLTALLILGGLIVAAPGLVLVWLGLKISNQIPGHQP